MHHGSEKDAQIAAIGSQMFEQATKMGKEKGIVSVAQLGATGQFPGGRLTDTDQGEIQFAVGIYEGKVIIDYGKPVHWVGMDAGQASSLARSLREKARELREDGPIQPKRKRRKR